MRPLTTQERRTLRIAGIVVGVYLLLFGAVKIGAFAARQRAEYVRLQGDARALKERARLYEERAGLIQKLMEGFHMDPMKLSRTTVVAQANAAIQRTAMASGIQVGVVRESQGQTARKELAAIQLEAQGPVAGLLKFLHQLDSVGYPVLVDSLQIGSDTARAGMAPGIPGGAPPGIPATSPPGTAPGGIPGGEMPAGVPAGIGMPGGFGSGMGGGGPGLPLKMNLTLILLDFDQWKQEVPHA
jgi:hypothetical protein